MIFVKKCNGFYVTLNFWRSDRTQTSGETLEPLTLFGENCTETDAVTGTGTGTLTETGTGTLTGTGTGTRTDTGTDAGTATGTGLVLGPVPVL